MSDDRQEFILLVHETIEYLKEEWGHLFLDCKVPPQSPLPSNSLPIPLDKEDQTTPKEKKIPPPSTGQVKHSPSSPPPQWSLTPLPVPEEEVSKFSAFFPQLPLYIPIRLIMTNQKEILFLQNVARAITRLIAPATLYKGELATLLKDHNVLLILAPLSLLKQKFPRAELHQLLKLDHLSLLPLADYYNPDLKRHLWNTLKSFQNTLQLS
ncbi:MAG: hypothetical protein R3E91_05075 [Chlamydiales bacterium]